MNKTNPEDTNRVGGAEAPRRVGSVGLNHAEHAVQLPEDEERDEKVVGVPELFESAVFGASALPHSEEHHYAQADPHQPSGDERPDDEVGGNEEHDTLARSGGAVVGHSEAIQVDNVGERVYNTANDDSPASGFVECDVLVERDDVAERCAPNDRDEISADGE
jgi:hypothetical protein